MPLEFNYDAENVEGLAVESLLEWIGRLHGELADSGAWEHLSTETHQQLMLLAKAAD